MRHHFLKDILKQLYKARGIDFTRYKRDIFKHQIITRMKELNLQDNPQGYLNYLYLDASECDRLIDTIGINVSHFFRDPIVFEIIAQSILPEIMEQNRRLGNSQIRVWSAGCAGGQEPYSMAILIYEALKSEALVRGKMDWQPYIFGTDIDQHALNFAQKGIYPREQLKDVKVYILDQHFIPESLGYFRIHPFIKKMVYFSQDDLSSGLRFAPTDSVFGTFDIVLCRNVLIYFSLELQEQVLNKLCKSLNTGGILILGEAESLIQHTKSHFIAIDHRNRIFKKVG